MSTPQFINNSITVYTFDTSADIEVLPNNDISLGVDCPKLEVEVYPYASLTVNTGAAATNLTANGYTAGEAIAAYSVVALVNGLLYQADHNTLTHISNVLGIAQNSYNPGDLVNVATDGIVTNNAWNWNISSNLRLFLDSNGSIVTSPDFNAVFMQEIGTIVGEDRIYLDIQEPTLLQA